MERKLEEFVFVPRRNENAVEVPSKITGEFAVSVYKAYQEAKKEFQDNPYFKLELKNDELIHSTLQDSALINQIIAQYGIRTLLPQDLRDMRIADMIKGKHYVNVVALILRGSNAKIYDERTKNIIVQLEERVDVSRLDKEPALITNLKVVPSNDIKNGGYGFTFVPLIGDNFNVVYSDKFLLKYRGWKFNSFDENGLPEGLNQNGDGKFTNYTEDSRLSRAYLGDVANLYSGWSSLDGSSDGGRVVVVSDAAGGATKKLEKKILNL